MKDLLISWEAYEHEPRNNSIDWYWTVGIITVALIVICILLNNLLLGIVIGLSSFIMILHTKRTPRVIDILITTKGIHQGEHIYPFENLHSYFLDKDTVTVPKLILKSKKFVMPYVIIRLDSVDLEEVDDVLREHMKKDDHPEPFLHKLLEKIGF